jgi:hypothetical protein
MRFMIIVKSTPDFEADTLPQTPDEKLIAAMADFHEELSKAGVLLDASGLQPSRKGWRIHYDGQKRTVVDGPFAESKELIAVLRPLMCAHAERRWNGRAAIRIRPERASQLSSKFVSCTNWTTSRRMRRSTGSVR